MTVESVPGSDSFICLKSCYGKYLAASDERFVKSTRHCAANVPTLPSRSQSEKMQANQRVLAPAPARASAPTSEQGFMPYANLAINTANLVVRATNLAEGFSNPEVSDAGNAPMGITALLDDVQNADVDAGNAMGDGWEFSDFTGGFFGQ
ncbi:hypothetical protein FNV43_RR00773 [Rhamnella rubrinervis]|uniref:DUF569 domain-containing protein n=1 Tax=Rhamnella rubrinervis TaxID=2594499 RepID=A0A8K0MSQ5_9ROSA|nr:hypothetical protein FNV43_RR00773 [Rhamnella rubrinervis]